MSMETPVQTVVQEVTKVSPVLAVQGAGIFGGITLSDAVHIVTLLYLGCQMAYLGWKFLRERKEK